MAHISIPPGVFDLLPTDPQDQWKSTYLWTHIETLMRELATSYGFREIRTPIFERTELFLRGVGETTDIVSKEMYTFIDKGNRSMTLRPEGTASVMRAFIEHQLQNSAPQHKLFYICPMFRYERAQAGRYRQHHQFGAEVIGISAPEQDAELIDLLYTLYNRLHLQNLQVSINSIGDAASRSNFRAALKDYLSLHYDALSADSKNRFESNPLRILDSKDAGDRSIVANAPSILDYLNDGSKEHFEALKKLLNALKIPFQVDPLLVRGLDYYNSTVFEVTSGNLGAQNSIAGGGRYDGLLKLLGGADLPSIGFGSGIERLIQTMLKQQVPLPSPLPVTLYIIPLGELSRPICFDVLHALRQENIAAEMDFTRRKLGKSMQYANQLGAKFVAVVGDNEVETGLVALKEMVSGRIITASLYELGKILGEENV